MGVNGLWPILSRAAQRRSLLEFAAEGFRSGPGGLGLLKIGVDASTGMHSSELSIVKAPAEAEAELAVLSLRSLIDIVLTTDVDALVFGTTRVARCPESPRRFENIEIYTDQLVSARLGLMQAERVLITLLVGGDHSDGLPGCGINIAYALTRYKLGTALLEAFATMDVQALTQFLVHWRNRLQYILSSDPDGFLDRRYPKLAGIISDTFPCYEDLKYYFSPLTKFSAYDSGSLPPVYEVKSSQPSLATLAAFCEHHFGLEHEALVTKMCTTIWEGAAVQQLCNLPKQPCDPTVNQPMTKSIHRWVTIRRHCPICFVSIGQVQVEE
ncbi:hypothetical protein BS17DRAFT_817621 [Gyrodon lividus]|nr:hypothetical protein BS17DRAFT_817621 [Gyrodon lividus]